ncbi:MAG: response regulator [Treponema sp.]|jgi:signal transduction histidine kinase/CheY-like chemotaxis protein/HPt (histidine-containing phosphotransfer) domain-containing protein|nr:response regulator [Treponema sp.]
MKIKRNLSSLFFTECDLVIAILDIDGFIIASSKKFEKFMGTISVTFDEHEQPVNPELAAGTPNILDFGPRYDDKGFPPEKKDLPRSIRDILGSHETVRFWTTLSGLVNRECKEVNFETTLRFKPEEGGELHWFNIHAWLIDDADDPKAPYIGINIQNKTLMREEEKRLLVESEITEKANIAKSQFLANMGHEIRTPIQTIVGMTELLENTELDHEQAEYARQVKFSANVLHSLINDILDYSKIETGKMSLERIHFPLEQIIEQAVEMVSLEAHKKGLEINAHIPKELNIMISGDPDKLRQIIIHLAKNAIKFTNEGVVTIKAKFAVLEKKRALQVAVADTGIGISEEARSKLFSTFMQADTSDTRPFSGAGLGLVISQSLVELMNGRIEMIPNEKGGSIFRFTVPLEISKMEALPLPEIENISQTRILVADDNEETRDILTEYLRDIGCLYIDSTVSGENALKMMEKAIAEGNPYTLCLLDLIMPETDISKLVEEIQNDEALQQSSFVLMTPNGYTGINAVAETGNTFQKWFRASISKPIKRKNLAETINAVLNEAPEPENDTEVSDNSTLINLATADKPLILIAEDNPTNQKLFSIIMEKLGFPVVLCNDGQEALDKAGIFNPELILMDIQMPVMNGNQAAKILRERGFQKPIIAITAGLFADEQEQCLKAGINEILLKPFNQTDIKNILEKWLPQHTEIFNIDDLHKTFMEDDAIAVSFLTRFIDRTGGQIENILILQQSEDWEAARREAHTIKGSSRCLGGRELGKAAERLEAAYKNINHSEMEAAFIPLKDAFNRFKVKAESFVQSFTNTNTGQ